MKAALPLRIYSFGSRAAQFARSSSRCALGIAYQTDHPSLPALLPRHSPQHSNSSLYRCCVEGNAEAARPVGRRVNSLIYKLNFCHKIFPVGKFSEVCNPLLSNRKHSQSTRYSHCCSKMLMIDSGSVPESQRLHADCAPITDTASSLLGLRELPITAA